MSDYLPQEILIKILARLPPKPLVRFRCVSKSWNSLISSSSFISTHLQQQTTTPTNDHQLIIRRYSKAHNSEVYTIHTDNGDGFCDENIRIEYPFRDYTRFYYRVVGSCSGVFCLIDDSFGPSDSVVIWNPVIKRQVRLPVLQPSFQPDVENDAGWCVYVMGFGFDVEINDYKVVRLAYGQVESGYSVPPEVHVYTLGTRNWREIDDGVPRNCVVEHFWSQVVIDGSVHWAAYRNIGEQGKVENLIMIFNLTREIFDEMPLPSDLENEMPINLTGVLLRGSLGVVQYDERVWGRSCCIWVMKKYGDVGSWSKNYCVYVDDGLGTILGLRRNGDILLTARNRGLVSYNPVDGREVDLGILGTKDSFYLGSYMESLILLDEGIVARERVPSESDSDSESECESSVEDDDDRFGDVEKSEFWMQTSVSHYLWALHRR